MVTVSILEPLLDYRCNLQGCCCKGWFISFLPEDLPRVLDAFDADERAQLVKGWTFHVDPDDNKLSRFQFGVVGDDDACQFLEGDGRCGLQVAKGTHVLPYLCRAFPAYCHDGIDGLEVHMDVVCPEVLDCIVDSEGPFRLVTVEADDASDLGLRASLRRVLPEIRIGEQTIAPDELRVLREAIFAALGDKSRPVLDRFAQIHYGLARVARGDAPATFTVCDEDPVPPFDGYFDECVSVHHPQALAKLFSRFRRFVFALSLDGAAEADLAPALAYDPDWRATVDPRDDAFQPMLRRYLAYRFFSAFVRTPQADQLSFTYGTIAHTLATAFRYAVGLSRWLDRPVDRTVLKVALGASEYVYRSVKVPPDSMPWFLP